MDTFIKLLEVIAKLAWPGIVIGIVVIFRPAVASIIESARSRKFTLKVGGQELTMDEASEQQRGLIADLQAQVVELGKRVEGSATPSEPALIARPEPTALPTNGILWVDDYPKNNSYFVEQFNDLGVKVDLALTTTEGIAKFSRRKYSVVISDMGRHEDGVENPDAGIDLLKAIRAKDAKVPFFIFCSTRGVRQHGDEARRLGVTAITSSPTELSGLLNLDELKAKA